MKGKNLLLLFVLAALWSPSFLFIKVGLRGFTPLTLALVRVALGASILLVILRWRRGMLRGILRYWRKFLVMGFFAAALPFALFSFGELGSDSGAAAIINGTTPIFTVILAHIFIAEERMNPRSLSGVLIGFAGILFIFLPEIEGAAPGSPRGFWGLAAFGIAAMSYGVAIVYSRLHLRGLPPMIAPIGQLLCAAVWLAPFALVFEHPWNLEPGITAVLAVVALAVLGTALAFHLYYRLLESASATFISLVTYIMPPVGILLGIVFLNEQPGWQALTGCALIIMGVMIVNNVPARVRRYLRRAVARRKGLLGDDTGLDS